MIVKFEVDHGVEFGKESEASIEVLNLLGEKYLELTPAGEGQLAEDTPIPLERTESAYDIVGVFGDLTTTTEEIDRDQLVQALDVVSTTMNQAAPEIEASFDGIARLSETVASRDAQIQALLRELQGRHQAAQRPQRGPGLADGERRPGVPGGAPGARRPCTGCWSTPGSWPSELRGVAQDNQEQIGPALARGRRAARAC